jgi:hypothetical protein
MRGYIPSLGFISQNILVITMRREKRRPVIQIEQLLDEAGRVEHLMAAGWTEAEIAKGLERKEKSIESIVMRRRGRPFDSRRAEVMHEVFEASIKAGRSIGILIGRMAEDEPMQGGCPTSGASLIPVHEADGEDKSRHGNEAAKAAKVELISRLMAAGFRKDGLAKSLGLSVGGLEKFFSGATGATFRELEDRIALDVAAAAVRADIPTSRILRQLDIDETTLHDRLGRTGVSLKGMREQVKQESIENARERIGKYLSKTLGKIPEGAPVRWKASGATADPGLYRQVFLHLMNGNTVTSFRDENPIPVVRLYQVARAILPDVRQRRREIARRVYELIQVPGVTPNERKVFELIAVVGMTDGQATATLGEKSAGITATKINLIKKIPELAPLLRYHSKATNNNNGP